MQIVHTLFIEIKSAQQREIKVEYTTWSKLVEFADYVFAGGYTWLKVFHVDITFTSNKLGTLFHIFSLL
jgi:Holliday junction resolvase